jgi:hypothetical protein
MGLLFLAQYFYSTLVVLTLAGTTFALAPYLMIAVFAAFSAYHVWLQDAEAASFRAEFRSGARRGIIALLFFPFAVIRSAWNNPRRFTGHILIFLPYAFASTPFGAAAFAAVLIHVLYDAARMWPDSGWGRFWKTLDRRVFSAIWPERRTAPVSSKDPMEWLMGQARQLEIQYAEAALLNVESQDFPDLLALDRAYGRLRGWLRSTASSLGGKSVLRKSLKDEEKQLKSLHADLRSTLALYRELRDGGGRG